MLPIPLPPPPIPTRLPNLLNAPVPATLPPISPGAPNKKFPIPVLAASPAAFNPDIPGPN